MGRSSALQNPMERSFIAHRRQEQSRTRGAWAGFAGKGLGRASLLQPQHRAADGGYFQVTRAISSSASSLLPCSESGDTTFGEGGRCSLISPIDSFADKKLFSLQPFCLAFVLVGFDIPLPAVTAAPGCSPPALSQPRLEERQQVNLVKSLTCPFSPSSVVL